jgi:TP901 family phage tail tape measure protein
LAIEEDIFINVHTRLDPIRQEIDALVAGLKNTIPVSDGVLDAGIAGVSFTEAPALPAVTGNSRIDSYNLGIWVDTTNRWVEAIHEVTRGGLTTPAPLNRTVLGITQSEAGSPELASKIEGWIRSGVQDSSRAYSQLERSSQRFGAVADRIETVLRQTAQVPNLYLGGISTGSRAQDLPVGLGVAGETGTANREIAEASRQAADNSRRIAIATGIQATIAEVAARNTKTGPITVAPVGPLALPAAITTPVPQTLAERVLQPVNQTTLPQSVAVISSGRRPVQASTDLSKYEDEHFAATKSALGVFSYPRPLPEIDSYGFAYNNPGRDTVGNLLRPVISDMNQRFAQTGFSSLVPLPVQSVYHLPSDTGGNYSPSVRQIRLNVDRLREADYSNVDEIQRILTHEYGHAIDHQLSPLQTPRKGIEKAVYLSELSALPDSGKLQAHTAQNLPLVAAMREILLSAYSSGGLENTGTLAGLVGGKAGVEEWISPSEVFARIFEQVFGTSQKVGGLGVLGGEKIRSGAYDPDFIAKVKPRVVALMAAADGLHRPDPLKSNESGRAWAIQNYKRQEAESILSPYEGFLTGSQGIQPLALGIGDSPILESYVKPITTDTMAEAGLLYEFQQGNHRPLLERSAQVGFALQQRIANLRKTLSLPERGQGGYFRLPFGKSQQFLSARDEAAGGGQVAGRKPLEPYSAKISERQLRQYEDLIKGELISSQTDGRDFDIQNIVKDVPQIFDAQLRAEILPHIQYRTFRNSDLDLLYQVTKERAIAYVSRPGVGLQGVENTVGSNKIQREEALRRIVLAWVKVIKKTYNVDVGLKRYDRRGEALGHAPLKTFALSEQGAGSVEAQENLLYKRAEGGSAAETVGELTPEKIQELILGTPGTLKELKDRGLYEMATEAPGYTNDAALEARLRAFRAESIAGILPGEIRQPETRQRIGEVIASRSPREQLFFMQYYAGIPRVDIARNAGVRPSSVKMSLQETIKAIRSGTRGFAPDGSWVPGIDLGQRRGGTANDTFDRLINNPLTRVANPTVRYTDTTPVPGGLGEMSPEDLLKLQTGAFEEGDLQRVTSVKDVRGDLHVPYALRKVAERLRSPKGQAGAIDVGSRHDALLEWEATRPRPTTEQGDLYNQLGVDRNIPQADLKRVLKAKAIAARAAGEQSPEYAAWDRLNQTFKNKTSRAAYDAEQSMLNKDYTAAPFSSEILPPGSPFYPTVVPASEVIDLTTRILGSSTAGTSDVTSGQVPTVDEWVAGLNVPKSRPTTPEIERALERARLEKARLSGSGAGGGGKPPPKGPSSGSGASDPGASEIDALLGAGGGGSGRPPRPPGPPSPPDNPLDGAGPSVGGSGWFDKIKSRAGTFLPFLALGAGIGFLRQQLTEAEQFRIAMSKIKAQIEDTYGNDAASVLQNFKQNIQDIARETGVSSAEIAQLGQRFQGTFGKGITINGLSGQALVSDQLSSAVKIGKVFGLTPAEAGNQLIAANVSFGASSRQIGNIAAQVENKTGVSGKELIDFLGNIAPVAQSAGFSLEKTAALGGVSLQRSGLSGNTLAENFSRILPAIANKKSDLLTLDQTSPDVAAARSTSGKSFAQAVGGGDAVAIFEILSKTFDHMDKTSQDFVVQLIGSRREAKALLAAFGDTKDLSDLEGSLNKNADTLQKRFDEVQKNISVTWGRIKESIQQVVQLILSSGLGDAITNIGKGLVDGLAPILALANIFGKLDTLAGGLLSRFASWGIELAVVSKLVGSIGALGSFTQLGASLSGGFGAKAGTFFSDILPGGAARAVRKKEAEAGADAETVAPLGFFARRKAEQDAAAEITANRIAEISGATSASTGANLLLNAGLVGGPGRFARIRAAGATGLRLTQDAEGNLVARNYRRNIFNGARLPPVTLPEDPTAANALLAAESNAPLTALEGAKATGAAAMAEAGAFLKTPMGALIGVGLVVELGKWIYDGVKSAREETKRVASEASAQFDELFKTQTLGDFAKIVSIKADQANKDESNWATAVRAVFGGSSPAEIVQGNAAQYTFQKQNDVAAAIANNPLAQAAVNREFSNSIGGIQFSADATMFSKVYNAKDLQKQLDENKNTSPKKLQQAYIDILNNANSGANLNAAVSEALASSNPQGKLLEITQKKDQYSGSDVGQATRVLEYLQKNTGYDINVQNATKLDRANQAGQSLADVQARFAAGDASVEEYKKAWDEYEKNAREAIAASNGDGKLLKEFETNRRAFNKEILSRAQELNSINLDLAGALGGTPTELAALTAQQNLDLLNLDLPPIEKAKLAVAALKSSVESIKQKVTEAATPQQADAIIKGAATDPGIVNATTTAQAAIFATSAEATAARTAYETGVIPRTDANGNLVTPTTSTVAKFAPVEGGGYTYATMAELTKAPGSKGRGEAARKLQDQLSKQLPKPDGMDQQTWDSILRNLSIGESATYTPPGGQTTTLSWDGGQLVSSSTPGGGNAGATSDQQVVNDAKAALNARKAGAETTWIRDALINGKDTYLGASGSGAIGDNYAQTAADLRQQAQTETDPTKKKSLLDVATYNESLNRLIHIRTQEDHDRAKKAFDDFVALNGGDANAKNLPEYAKLAADAGYSVGADGKFDPKAAYNDPNTSYVARQFYAGKSAELDRSTALSTAGSHNAVFKANTAVLAAQAKADFASINNLPTDIQQQALIDLINVKAAAEDALVADAQKEVDALSSTLQRHGDWVGSARAAAQGAQNVLDQMIAAGTYSPGDIAAQQDKVDAANIAGRNAAQRIKDAGFDKTIATDNAAGDPVKAAVDNLAKIGSDQANALGNDKLQFDAARIAAQETLRRAVIAVADSNDAKLKALKRGDPLGQAQDDVSIAKRHVAEAKGVIEKNNAAVELFNAQLNEKEVMDQLRDSHSNLIQAQLHALGSDSGDIAATQENLNNLQASLKSAISEGKKGSAIDDIQANIVNTQKTLSDERFQAVRDQNQFDYDLGKITKTQLIARMRAQLSGLSENTRNYKELLLAIHNLEKSSDLQYNLPTALKISTLYEARRLNQGGSFTGTAAGMNIGSQVNNPVINIMVASGDPQAIADAVGNVLIDSQNRNGFVVKKY